MLTGTLRRDDVFDFLRPDQVDALSNAAEVVNLSAGELVYQQGDPADYFYIVRAGQVSLRLPGRGNTSLLIDQIGPGGIFGSCVSLEMQACNVTARSATETELLRIRTEALRSLLDDDPRMGYMIQSKISENYFNRYLEAMRKLQAIVMNVPLEAH